MGTRKWYPYPWARVWVYAGTGPGGPKNTRGLPILSYDLPILYYEFYL